jgi:hypothetical protein
VHPILDDLASDTASTSIIGQDRSAAAMVIPQALIDNLPAENRAPEVSERPRSDGNDGDYV